MSTVHFPAPATRAFRDQCSRPWGAFDSARGYQAARKKNEGTPLVCPYPTRRIPGGPPLPFGGTAHRRGAHTADASSIARG